MIGRDEALLIQIVDPKVSRKHMQIRYDKDHKSYLALDMKSKHGVVITGTKIDEEIVLHDNDNIQIGDTVILFTFQDFKDRESALNHYKNVGERRHPTITTYINKQ